MKNKLAYYVYVGNFNKKTIEKYNVLSDHIVKAIKAKTKGFEDKQAFSEAIKQVIMYHFWAKCEWEVVITDWPTHIDIDEVTRLQKELEEYREKWEQDPYSLGVRLKVAEKIDVYKQVEMNWDIFINYLWDNLKR